MDVEEVVDDLLEHHGIKGMKWGVRRNRPSGPQSVTVSDRRRSVRTSGGAGHPAHPDAVRVREIGQIGKKSGVKALSDEQLKAYERRINLEQNVKRLQYNESSPPRKFILKILGQTGKTTTQNIANDVASQQVRKRLIKLGVLAVA